MAKPPEYEDSAQDKEAADKLADFEFSRTNVSELCQAAMKIAKGPYGLMKELWNRYKRSKSEPQKVRILLAIMHIVEADTALNGKNQNTDSMDTESIRQMAMRSLRDLRSTESQIEETEIPQ